MTELPLLEGQDSFIKPPFGSAQILALDDGQYVQLLLRPEDVQSNSSGYRNHPEATSLAIRLSPEALAKLYLEIVDFYDAAEISLPVASEKQEKFQQRIDAQPKTSFDKKKR